MAKTMYWYSEEWQNSDIDANDGSGHYLNWFQDGEHTQPCNVAAGLPTSGDTVYGSDEAPWMQLGGDRDWSGVTIAAGAIIFSNGTLTLSTTSVVEAAASIRGDGSANLVSGANFKGDIDFGNNSTPRWGQITLTAGWKTNNGAPGGSVTVQADGPLSIAAPAGSTAYNTVNVASSMGMGYSDLDLSGWSFSVTGSFTYHCGGFFTPPGSLALNSGTATAMGVTVGHVPAIDKVLPSDNLFGVTGTAKTGGAPGGMVVV